ncbi:hypothetical protein H7U32_04715 [Bifidobacterium pullorum subsp. saeculare]|uniref:Phosphotyrosine protein phosphatase I domain-containing protein n=1 Tax=Bifidobacterium pullorum subsp. saeculare TaxID=78257 RepID=A0A938WXF0_9BIFI|nr:hypothetical protein [Bifidobacterium pullorum]MBM6699626.1 hypothetical protein [Bifidobacterium pullorum subsp. saeculare]
MRVLFVCHGNICRSALAEYLLRAALPAGADVEVASRGLLDIGPRTMDPQYLDWLAARGIDASGHHAAQVSGQDVSDAGLILLFTDQQLSELCERFPTASRKTWLLTDFAALAQRCLADGDLASAATPGRRLAAIAECAPFKRPFLPHPQDIEDPHHESAQLYADVAARIDGAVSAIAEVL